MAKKVFIGVGHGGSDPGAVANGFLEKDVNLSIAVACNAELAKYGVTTAMSRVKDEYDPLSQEVKECNAFAPDLAVEIHNNAGGGDGAEVYHYSGGGTGKVLAQNILDEIVRIGQNSRGIKVRLDSSGKDYYGWIRSVDAPSVIVECAFLDNRKDLAIIDTASEQKAMGIAIAKGVLKTLGVEYQAQPVQQPEQKAEQSTVAVQLDVLQKGSAGSQVQALQRLLSDYYKSTVDGDFGALTDSAVRAFQRDAGLSVDGVVGQQTWGVLLGLSGGCSNE